MANDPTLDGEIADHYAQDINEKDRLTADPVGRLEWLRTWDVIRRHFPAPPATVLDVGGGPGVYALPLARAGYIVHLLDPVARHIVEARSSASEQPDHPLARAAVGEARSLPHDDATADAVLLAGPLYHLVDRNDRVQALTEAARVLRPGGVVVAAAISRFASLCDGLARGFLADAEFQAIVTRDLTDGQHRNPTARPGWFTTAYFHDPEELAAEVADASLQHITTVAVEGPAWVTADLGGWLDDPARRETLLDLVASVEAEPSLLGASPHLLVVGRKPL